ncbi:MAG: hypothetical protein ACK5H1_05435 [Tenacibaculum sp.]
MKIYKICTVLLLATIFFSCNDKIEKKESFDFGVWVTAKKGKTNKEYKKEFEKYKQAGIDEVLINTLTNSKELQKLTSIAKKAGLRVHAWIMTINRPNDSVALKHPEWYAVSREGKSCFDVRPYVDYYQWLCPTNKESKSHILGLIESLAKVKGIESVHLDYIRFSDIFLPIGLLPKYNLKQYTEMAEFDFCYCSACISEFKKIHDKNPTESKNIAIDMEWKNFRLNAVKSIVDNAYKIVKSYNKKLTAAVFPYPEMASHMVRQRWDKWNIDEVYPMVYHGFYNKEINWIAYATKQGVEDLKGKNIGLNTAVYLPSFKSAKELAKAINYAKDNGAKGVAFYEGNNLTKEYLSVIKNFKTNLKL